MMVTKLVNDGQSWWLIVLTWQFIGCFVDVNHGKHHGWRSTMMCIGLWFMKVKEQIRPLEARSEVVQGMAQVSWHGSTWAFHIFQVQRCAVSHFLLEIQSLVLSLWQCGPLVVKEGYPDIVDVHLVWPNIGPAVWQPVFFRFFFMQPTIRFAQIGELTCFMASEQDALKGFAELRWSKCHPETPSINEYTLSTHLGIPVWMKPSIGINLWVCN